LFPSQETTSAFNSEKETEMMKKKILSLALALALCLGLAVPAFAAGTETHTIDGITITASSDGTISFTGSGVLESNHMQAGLPLLIWTGIRNLKN